MFILLALFCLFCLFPSSSLSLVLIHSGYVTVAHWHCHLRIIISVDEDHCFLEHFIFGCEQVDVLFLCFKFFLFLFVVKDIFIEF